MTDGHIIVDNNGKEINFIKDGMVRICGGERKQVYEILCGSYNEELCCMVNLSLSNGAALIGGPFIVGDYFMQAILRYEDKDENK